MTPGEGRNPPRERVTLFVDGVGLPATEVDEWLLSTEVDEGLLATEPGEDTAGVAFDDFLTIF